MSIVDWLPVASGTLLGLGGMFVTWRAGKRQQDTAVALARVQVDLAREERRHKALEQAYSELIASETRRHFEYYVHDTNPRNYEAELRKLAEKSTPTEATTAFHATYARSHLWSDRVKELVSTMEMVRLSSTALLMAGMLRELGWDDEITKHLLSKISTSLRARVENLLARMNAGMEVPTLAQANKDLHDLLDGLKWQIRSELLEGGTIELPDMPSL